MEIIENYQDEYDYLTEILNRRSGEYRIAEQLSKGEGALLVIDLDNFKMVNDTYGHLMGDYVLKQVADILKMHEKKHIVARMAGDEFLICIILQKLKLYMKQKIYFHYKKAVTFVTAFCYFSLFPFLKK